MNARTPVGSDGGKPMVKMMMPINNDGGAHHPWRQRNQSAADEATDGGILNDPFLKCRR